MNINILIQRTGEPKLAFRSEYYDIDCAVVEEHGRFFHVVEGSNGIYEQPYESFVEARDAFIDHATRHAS